MIMPLINLCCNNNDQKHYINRKVNKTNNSSILIVDNKVLDLGEIDKSDKAIVPFNFILKNESDDTLYIDKIDVSCSCVKIIKYTEQLEARQYGNLIGEISLKNQSGHLRKSIFINHSDTCLAIVKIVGNILD